MWLFQKSLTCSFVDQVIAAQIARADRLPSIEMAIGDARPINHAGKALPMPKVDLPKPPGWGAQLLDD